MADITQTACPQCNSVGTLTITERLAAREVGEFSLPGVQMKFSARGRPVLTCSACPFALLGEYDPDGAHVTFKPRRVKS